MNHLAKHLLIELYGCEADRLADVKFIERVIKEAAEVHTESEPFFRKIENTLEGVIPFEKGFCGFHSFPDMKYIGLDFFSHDEKIDNEKILSFLLRKFGATKYSASEIKRGDKTEV